MHITKPVRTIYALLLTGLVIVNLFGFYTLFILKQTNIKNEIAEKICNGSLTERHQVLSFDNDEFSKLQFSDNGKELNFDGKLYDVVSIEHAGAQTHIMVEYDSKETELVNGFVALFNGKSEGGSGVPLKDVLQLLQKEFVPNQSICLFAESFSNTHYFIPTFYGSTGSSAGILVPPPCVVA